MCNQNIAVATQKRNKINRLRTYMYFTFIYLGYEIKKKCLNSLYTLLRWLGLGLFLFYFFLSLNFCAKAGYTTRSIA